MKPTNRARLRTSLAGLLVAVTTAGTAGAADDGGTRSVFALGAGNRALAMGGAFVAVSDDASAAAWNPGGLGSVPRRQFQASRATLFDLDAVEDYASLVLPSWRFGTASLTLRRLAVGGIEGRDEHNGATNDELSSDCTEFLLGYGRSLTDALTAGATLKLRREALAGYSASGFGSDLGFVLLPGSVLGADGSWAQNLTVGLSLQNLVAPSLRLDQEAVPDPLTVRTGIAYRKPLRNGGGILTAVDLERSAQMRSRIHTGLEFSPTPALSLRVGWRPQAPTAGVGIRWRGVSVDYLFEDSDLGAGHRFGLSWTFGGTVDERRLAARHAQEEALQERLAEAFTRRQSERSRQLLTEVEAAYRGGLYDQAIEQLALIQALSPGLEGAAEWEVRCWRMKAEQLERDSDFTEAALNYARALETAPADSAARSGAERCRRESDRRSLRSEEVRRQFATALDAFCTGDLLKARQEFRAIRTANPEDKEAGAMLDRTERAIAGRVSDLLDQSNRYLRGGLLEEAQAAIARVRALNPSARGLAQAESSLSEQKQREKSPESASGSPSQSAPAKTAVTSPSPASSKPSITARQRKEMEDLYARGLAAMQAERSVEALRYWELVYSIDPDYQQVRDHLKREYLMVGMDSFADGRLEEAAGYWQRALQVDPNDEKTKGYLARAEQQLSRTREILGSGR